MMGTIKGWRVVVATILLCAHHCGSGHAAVALLSPSHFVSSCQNPHLHQMESRNCEGVSRMGPGASHSSTAPKEGQRRDSRLGLSSTGADIKSSRSDGAESAVEDSAERSASPGNQHDNTGGSMRMCKRCRSGKVSQGVEGTGRTWQSFFCRRKGAHPLISVRDLVVCA